MKFECDPPSDGRLAQGLAALKREGGLVLIIGAASVAHGDICRRFLEGDDARVLVDTDGLVRDDDMEAAEEIRKPVLTRSSPAVATSRPVPGFASIVAELEAKMWSTAREGDAPKVCFDSLRPFVDMTDTQTLVSGLESIAETASDVDAVVHVHIPAMVKATPSELYDAVDAVVEVHHHGGTTYQRWQLPEETELTEWVEI